jgi:hypothetical protein
MTFVSESHIFIMVTQSILSAPVFLSISQGFLLRTSASAASCGQKMRQVPTTLLVVLWRGQVQV